jgi:hypothetical protein
MEEYIIYVSNKTGKGSLQDPERGEMNLTFRRNFDTCDRVEWDELEEELEGIQLSDDEDSMRWILTLHG